jgi:hypothetical protein
MSEGFESSGGGSKNTGGAIAKSARKFMLFSVIVYLTQIYLHVPEDRAVAACWPPYLAYRFATVKVPQWIMPKDHRMVIKQAIATERWNRQCIAYLDDKKWIKFKQFDFGVIDRD